MGFLDNMWRKVAQQTQSGAGQASQMVHTVLGDVPSLMGSLTDYAYNNTAEPLADAFTNHRDAQARNHLTAPPGTISAEFRIQALQKILAGLGGGDASFIDEQARQQYLHPQPEGKRIGMTGLPGHNTIGFWEA